MEEYNFCPGPCPLCDEIRRQRKNTEDARIKKMKDDMRFFAQTVWALPISSHVIRETMLLFDDEPSKEDFKKEVTLLRKEKFDLQEDNVRLKKLYEELQERTNYLRRCWEETSKRLLEAQRMNSQLTAMPSTFASQFRFNNEPFLNKEISELNKKLTDALRDAKANDTLATDLNRQVAKLNQQLKDSEARYINMRDNRNDMVKEVERHGKVLGETRKELEHNKTRVAYLSGLVENERGANAGRIGRICDLEEKLRDANGANASLRAHVDDVEKRFNIIGNANRLLREQIDDLKDRYTTALSDQEVSCLISTNPGFIGDLRWIDAAIRGFRIKRRIKKES
jgi:chromosome segregation ATPase